MAKMTEEQMRKAEIKALKEQLNALKREKDQKATIKAEREQIKQLKRDLHPSKFSKLGNLLGKRAHGGETTGKSLIKFGKALSKELKKADKELEKSRIRVNSN